MSNNTEQSRLYGKSLTNYIIMALLFTIPINWVTNIITGPFENKEQVALYNKKRLEAIKAANKQITMKRYGNMTNKKHNRNKLPETKHKQKNLVDVKKHSTWFIALQNLISLLMYGFLFYNIHRQNISFNKHGVWAKVGIFPWTRGQLFVKWEDIDRIGYSQNPIGWLFDSANIHIIHRYRGTEEVIKGIFRGKEFSGIATEYKHTNIDKIS